MLHSFRPLSISIVSPFRYGARLLSVTSNPVTVFVGNLPPFFNDSKFDHFATSMGVVGHSARVVMSNKVTVQCRGFGYLDFATSGEAQNAMAKLTGAVLHGKVLKLDLDTGTRRAASSVPAAYHTVFIKNIGRRCDAAIVQQFIEKIIGKVPMNVRLSKGDYGFSKGYGHVDFSTENDRDLAVAKLNGKMFDGRSILAEAAALREFDAPLSNAPRRPGYAIVDEDGGTAATSVNRANGDESDILKESEDARNRATRRTTSRSKERNYEDF